MRAGSSGDLAVDPLGDLGDGGATTSRSRLDFRPRRAGLEHGGNSFVPSGVQPAALIPPFHLGSRLSLRLTTAPVLVVLAHYGGQHVEHHAVDRVEHAGGEI